MAIAGPVTDEQFPDAFTIADFYPLQQRQADIGRLGSSESRQLGGVVLEQAAAFGYPLPDTPGEEDYAGLIGSLGRSKFSRENVADVQRRLGTEANIIQMTRNWAVRLGMGKSVLRSFMNAEQQPLQDGPTVVITGGVPNWMWSRAAGLDKLAEQGVVDRDARVILAAGEGKATGRDPLSGSDLRPGLTQAGYMQGYVRSELQRRGFSRVELAAARSDKGRDVAKAALEAVESRTSLRRAEMLVVATPSSWVETAGQIRRMAREQRRGFDATGQQLTVATYGIEIGGLAEDPKDEPPLEYQSPWTATGLAARSYRELFLHTAPS